MRKFILQAMQQIASPISAFLMVLVVLLNPVSANAAKPPAYFVDESKLPFTELPGATALWGVHGGAGYRVEVNGIDYEMDGCTGAAWRLVPIDEDGIPTAPETSIPFDTDIKIHVY